MITETPRVRSRASMVYGSLIRMADRVRIIANRWQRNADGVAAVEFAFIAPILSIMFIGAVELSQVIAVNRRVSQIAGSVGDLVARADTKIPQSDIGDIMNVGGFIMEPYDKAPVQIILRNVTSSPASATTTKQSWTCTYTGSGGTNGTTTCSCTNSAQAIPANLVSTNDSVVVAAVTYAYKPLTFDYFMKGSGLGTNGIYTLSRTAYLKPRGQAAMLLQNNGSACPALTFP